VSSSWHDTTQLPDADRPRSWIGPYYASFNGLRGLAVGMVFVCHYAFLTPMPFLAGFTWTGVDLFFVLSGFLITGILYDALPAPHFFRNFYTRRALRIFPIFYGFFVVVFLLTPLLHLHWSWGLLAYAGYFGNFFTPFADLAHHNPTTIAIVHHGRSIDALNIGHLWSLCVEEQFYLMWPAAIFLVRERRRLMKLCVAMGLLALALRCVLFYAMPRQYGGEFIFWGTFTRMDTLLAGAWLALWLRGKALSPAQLKRLAYWVFFGSCALLGGGLMMMHFALHRKPVEFIQTVGYSLLGLAASGVLLRSLDEAAWLSRLLRNRFLTRLGIVSYGFYFLHNLPYQAVAELAGKYPRTSAALPFAVFAAVFALAELSFRFYESPFLRLKDVLAPQPKLGRTPVPLHVPEPQPYRSS
jgi:peptidoglycan/LPS O-acetylase OafA/YrhL